MTTISEIAKEAGLGRTTVSRYLNNQPYVSEEKRKRIEEAIKKLDYVPNTVAKQLRTNKTNQIGILVSRITNPFFAELFDQIERQLHKYGYEAMIMQTYDDPKIEKNFLERLESHEVDAVMLASIEDSNYVAKMMKKYRGKVILVNEKIPGIDNNQIVLDHYHATKEGLNYLYKKGAQDIAYVTGDKFQVYSHGGTRNQAYTDFLNQHNQEICSDWIFENCHNVDDGKKIANSIKNMDKRPQAIFTNSDEIAVGLIYQLKKLDIKVPEQILVMGYDDQPFSKYALVPITTIRQPVKLLAQNAVKMLLDNLNVKNSIENKILELKVVVRQSA